MLILHVNLCLIWYVNDAIITFYWRQKTVLTTVLYLYAFKPLHNTIIKRFSSHMAQFLLQLWILPSQDLEGWETCFSADGMREKLRSDVEKDVK